MSKMTKLDSFVAKNRQGKEVRGFVYKDEAGYILMGDFPASVEKRFMSIKTLYAYCSKDLGLHAFSNIERSIDEMRGSHEEPKSTKSHHMSGVEIR